MIRSVPLRLDASGGRTATQDDNPFLVADVEENIKKELEKKDFYITGNLYYYGSSKYCRY